MAWQDEMVPFLRVIINDMSGTQSFCDARLEEVIVAAAYLVKQEMQKLTAYTVNIAELSISPDPTSTSGSGRDDAFINLVVLKAACLVDVGTLRTKAAIAGITAKLGPASLQTNDALKGYLEILAQGPCKAYDDLKRDYLFDGGRIVKAVFSPFVGNNFDSRSLGLFGSEIKQRDYFSGR